MAQLFGDALSNPYLGLIIAIVIVAVAVGLRLYLMRSGNMRAKCPKCGAVFDASLMFSEIHIGPWKTLKCPSCEKVSFMNAYTKDPLNWPAKNAPKQTEPQLEQEDLERKRIEDSKYERF